MRDAAPVKRNCMKVLWAWTSCRKTLWRRSPGLALYEANLRADIGLGYDKLYVQFWSETPYRDLRAACQEPRTAKQMVAFLRGRERARKRA